MTTEQPEHDAVHRDLGPDMDNLFATREIYSGGELDLKEHFNSKQTESAHSNRG